MFKKEIRSFKDVKYPYKEKYITLDDGMDICYIDKGVGFPLIFIHGMGGDLTNWTYNIKYFKDNYRCIGLDLPGYGKSGRKKMDYTIHYYIDVLEEFLRKLNIDRCILVGNSMGGHIATGFTLRAQDRVDKLVLVDSAGLTRLGVAMESMINLSLNTAVLKNTPVSIIEQGVRNNFNDPENKECKRMVDVLSKIYQNDEEYSAFCHAVKSSMKTMINSRIEWELRKIKIPVLLVWGKYDCMVPINYAYKFKRKTKNSKLVIIDDAGHMPMLEKHSTFNNILETFIVKTHKGFLVKFKEILFS